VGLIKWTIVAVLSAAMLALLAAAAYLVHTRRPSTVTAADFEHLRIYPAWLRPKGVVYLLSGAHGWSTTDEETARDLARTDHLVFGIDTAEFLAILNQKLGDKGCAYMPGMLEDYSRTWQRNADFPQYLAPALLGSNLGATLVYETQVQAPPTAFSAAVVVDPDSTIYLRHPFCDHPAAAKDSAGQTVKADRPGKFVPLRIVIDGAATTSQREFATSVPEQTPKIVTDAGMPLHRIFTKTLGSIEAENDQSGVADLPLAEVPAAQSGCDKGYAVLYSGDGGWRDLDRSLADLLASKGMSVVGVDVLRYYWKEKPAADAARDLARIMRYYGTHWHCNKVILIGFSFGADVLPFIVTRLPQDARSQVALITLLSPERTTAFEVQVNGWLGGNAKAGVPVGPEVKKLTGTRIQCIYGQEEGNASLCTDASAGALDVVAKTGGHHFDRNYGELADEILAASAK
jgi:type IV secretory pathway VirJ component